MYNKGFKIIAFLLSVVIVCLTGCRTQNDLDYYADTENYVWAKGTVSYIQYSDDKSGLYLEFSDLDYAFDDTCFKLVGQNLVIAQGKGVVEKLQLGDVVTFCAAPRYFGDGYVIPIAALSVYGEEWVGFEEGHSNLMTWLDTR